MGSDNSGNGRPYRERLYGAAVGLYKNLRYLVFIYVLGTALAVIAIARDSGDAERGLSLGLVLSAYGLAALAAAIFIYAFVKLVLLACAAFGEWLCEQHEDDTGSD